MIKIKEKIYKSFYKPFLEFLKERELFLSYKNNSYAQEWEDMILKKIFWNKRKWFYIDIWAHHPKKISNTYHFYKKWWNWINIDPLPWTKKLFDKYRKKDINLEYAISNSAWILNYYMFNKPALNTFSVHSKVRALKKFDNAKLIRELDIEVLRLDFLLEKYNIKEIDFISIDVEWLEYNVVISNDWFKFRPKVILIEIWSEDVKNIFNDKTIKFLLDKWYYIKAKTFNTIFLLDQLYFKNNNI